MEALKGRNTAQRLAPVQGFIDLDRPRIPRAVPWAIIFRPFRAAKPCASRRRG